ncbi:toll/interleukin-1 receptor domain-containing protein [Geodermatophilus saharensis]|uniref:toll/interleukin-1 receptor domain-containing protein n=1 Tax=Geodermatophilus saharensis TaxID=1137994 RepID=UPI000B7919C7|nr:toll/interleukin-1 receptor domain-containing protein [Geodermatophilus saharensis]
MTEDFGGSGGVFLSWTRADTERRGPLGELVVALRAAGVPVWIDDVGIEPFDSIPERVRSGLAQAKVLLAWYSQAYPTRRACREELTLALLAAERSGQGAGRVLVVNPEPGMDHVLEARLLDCRFAGPDDLADLPALAALIAERVAQHSTPFGDLPAPGRPRWYGGAGWEGGSTRFVGRLGQLWAVHDRLHRTSGLVGPGAAGRSVAVVSGLGGMGKSLLAVEYAHLFSSLYPGGVVWLSAAGNDPTGTPPSRDQTTAAADTAFAQLATDLGLDVAHLEPDRVRERVKTELDRRGDKKNRPAWMLGAARPRWCTRSSPPATAPTAASMRSTSRCSPRPTPWPCSPRTASSIPRSMSRPGCWPPTSVITRWPATSPASTSPAPAPVSPPTGS